MDPGTIIGVVSLIIQVISSVDKAIASFERLQNAPRDIREFRRSVARLQRHYTALQADLESAPSKLLHEDDLHDIGDTLTLCDDFFSKRDESLRNEGTLNNILRATWTIQNEERLARLKSKIDAHYTTILTPLWIQSISATSRVILDQPDTPTQLQIQTDDSVSETGTHGQRSISSRPMISQEGLQRLEQTVERLRAISNKETTERTLNDLDETLQICWAQLGIPVREIFDNAGLTVDRRRLSIQEYAVAPTLLYLSKAPEQHERLILERVHIMARDDKSRILQYQNRDASIHVTHIIPYRTIPWTAEPTSTRVSFLKTHIITVRDSKGYHLYNIDPQYHFRSIETCNRFLNTLRERDLLGRPFEAVEITERGNITSRRQVVRFWRKTFPSGSALAPLTTMTFLQNSAPNGKQHQELDVKSFRSTPRFQLPFLAGGARESDTLDIISMTSRNGNLQIKFETLEVAKNFKAQFEELHPSRAPAPQLQLAHHSTSSPSNQQTYTPNQARASQSSPTMSPGQFPPGSTSGHAVSLHSASPSIATRTPVSTPADTPSDTAWSAPAPSTITELTNLTLDDEQKEESSDMLSAVLAVMSPKEERGE